MKADKPTNLSDVEVTPQDEKPKEKSGKPTKKAKSGTSTKTGAKDDGSSSEDEKPKGVIDLSGCTVKAHPRPEKEKKGEYQFDVHPPPGAEMSRPVYDAAVVELYSELEPQPIADLVGRESISDVRAPRSRAPPAAV